LAKGSAVGLEEGLAYVAGAGLVGSVFWLARIPLKGLCDVWVEKVRGKENRRLEEERRKTELAREEAHRETELALEEARRETQLVVIRTQALAALPPIETRVSAGELPPP
jgi:hypothetical protein